MRKKRDNNNTVNLKLRRVIFMNDDNYSKLAEALDIGSSCFSKKMYGSNNFTLRDVKIIMDRYSLKPDEVVDIFLN